MENQGASQVWAEVTALARLPGVLDLGQGWPDMGASEVARSAASEAMLSDEDPRSNQYSPPFGAPELVAAIDRYYRATGSLPVDSVERDVLVTTSATEALYVTLQALCDPGDEVVFLEPFFRGTSRTRASSAPRRGPCVCERTATEKTRRRRPTGDFGWT